MSESVELDVLESNELIFNINVEGTTMAHKTRMVLENKDVSYMFEGKASSTDGNVSFLIPEGLITEGSYPARIEVIVGNKILVPMNFSTVFKGSINMNSGLVETTSKESQIEAKISLVPIVKKVKTQPVVQQQKLRSLHETIEHDSRQLKIQEKPSVQKKITLKDRYNKKH